MTTPPADTRRANRAAGLCACGNALAPGVASGTDQPHRRCPECLDRRRAKRRAGSIAKHRARRADGLCLCGNALPPGVMPGTDQPHRRCPECLDRRRAKRQARFDANVAAGLCPCGNAPAPGGPPKDDPHRRCPECLERPRRESGRPRHARAAGRIVTTPPADTRRANRAAGLCACGDARAPGLVPGTGRPYRRCPACLERRRATRQDKRRTNVAAGLCPCGNAPAPSIAPSDDQPYRHCPECLGRFSATRRAQAAS